MSDDRSISDAIYELGSVIGAVDGGAIQDRQVDKIAEALEHIAYRPDPPFDCFDGEKIILLIESLAESHSRLADGIHRIADTLSGSSASSTL